MANFQKHGQNVNGCVIPATAGMFELGLWGPVDTRNGNELTVSVSGAGASVGIKKAGMLSGQPVRVYQITGLPKGKTLIVAKDYGGLVWTSVTLEVSAGGGSSSATGTLYTKDPNEVVTKNTKPAIKDVHKMVLGAWSDLTDMGARTLTSQFGHETAWGRYCFNWNLGNVKSTADNPHMYLRGVWELDTPTRAQSQVNASNGLGHIATADEIKAHGWATQAGKSIVVFNPPHPQCRFRAYASLADGAQKWLTHHKGIAGRNANYLKLLNAGDVSAVAHALKQAGYYTGPEPAYARGMKTAMQKVNQELGPVT
jgi:hypothetical protein